MRDYFLDAIALSLILGAALNDECALINGML